MSGRILTGTAEEWGLPPARLEALDAELADHAACLAERGAPEAVGELKARANSGRGRRRLTGPHLAEQVAATLARWPSRSEWRELCWLLAWFAVILLSDFAARQAVMTANVHGFGDFYNPPGHTPPLVTAWIVTAWLLQAVARAGFFTSFTVSLVRAWRAGRGVLLARILQLKLIHTVLVVAAMWVLSFVMSNYFNYLYISAEWPEWLTAPYLLAYGLAIALAVLLANRRRLWPWALGIALCTLFLYPAAPVRNDVYKVAKPISYRVLRDGTGEFIRMIPDDDSVRIAEKAQKLINYGQAAADLDIEHNIWYFKTQYPVYTCGTVQGRPVSYGFDDRYFDADPRYTKTKFGAAYYLPLFCPHAALAWLAAPIPVLGFVGLLGLLVLMGRRSLSHMLMYGALVFFALASTVLPFFFNENGDLINISPDGVVSGPLPGFDSLLFGSPLSEVWTIILGLLLSACIPWVLVALFLKPQPPRLPDDTAQLAE